MVGDDWERHRHYAMILEEIRAREGEELKRMGTKREENVR